MYEGLVTCCVEVWEKKLLYGTWSHLNKNETAVSSRRVGKQNKRPRLQKGSEVARNIEHYSLGCAVLNVAYGPELLFLQGWQMGVVCEEKCSVSRWKNS